MYSNKEFDCYSGSIFSCLVTDGDNTLVIENLALRRIGDGALREETVHLFLGWTIERALSWAKPFEVESVLIQTKIPHATEWFIEYGYDIRNIGVNGYSGMKLI